MCYAEYILNYTALEKEAKMDKAWKKDLQMHNVKYKILFFEQKSSQTYYSSPTEEFMSLQRASSLDDIKNAKNRKQPTAFCHT